MVTSCHALGFLLHLAAVTLATQKTYFTVDVDHVIHTTNPLSPSVAMGIGIFEYGIVNSFSDARLMTLARSLGESYLRVGGTKQDYVIFRPTADFWQPPASDTASESSSSRDCLAVKRTGSALLSFVRTRALADFRSAFFSMRRQIYGLSGALKPIYLTEKQWEDLNKFCECVGWKLIYGLNLLVRNGSSWDSTNAEKLIKFAEHKHHVNWQLGNEPNSYEHKHGTKLTPQQIGRDFVQLRSILDRSKWWDSSFVIGPDANRMMTRNAVKFISRFLSSAENATDGVSFHQYYLNGRLATSGNFLNQSVLDSLTQVLNNAKKGVRRAKSNQPLWLSETASAYGGGAFGLSSTFLSGFMWLDKLGVTARSGIDTVIRQTFIEGNYAMLDSSFNPLPDYWTTLLYKRLVGNRVLQIEHGETIPIGNGGSQGDGLRIYAQCTNTERSTYPVGSVTVYFINLTDETRVMILGKRPVTADIIGWMYMLQSADASSITSTKISLNGKLLHMVDETTLPELEARHITRQTLITTGVDVFAHSYGFLVLANVNAPACL